VRTPPEAAHNVTGISLHGLEGRIQHYTSHGVVDNIEAFASCASGHVFFQRASAIVDRMSAEIFHNAALLWRDGGEDSRSERACNLNCDVADAADHAVNFITGLKIEYVRAYPFDNTRHIQAQHCEEWLLLRDRLSRDEFSCRADSIH